MTPSGRTPRQDVARCETPTKSQTRQKSQVPLNGRRPDRLTVWCRFFAKKPIQNVKLWQNSKISQPKVLCAFQTGRPGVPGYCMGGGTQ